MAINMHGTPGMSSMHESYVTLDDDPLVYVGEDGMADDDEGFHKGVECRLNVERGPVIDKSIRCASSTSAALHCFALLIVRHFHASLILCLIHNYHAVYSSRLW